MIVANSTRIAASALTQYHSGMTTSVYDVRLKNLRLLIKQWESATSLARKLGHANASFLVQLAGPNPRRTISEKVARDIEAKLRLPAGWMDQPHADNLHEFDDAVLRDCVRLVAAGMRDAGLQLDPEIVATLTSLAYEHAKASGEVDKRFISMLLQLTNTKH